MILSLNLIVLVKSQISDFKLRTFKCGSKWHQLSMWPSSSVVDHSSQLTQGESPVLRDFPWHQQHQNCFLTLLVLFSCCPGSDGSGQRAERAAAGGGNQPPARQSDGLLVVQRGVSQQRGWGGRGRGQWRNSGRQRCAAHHVSVGVPQSSVTAVQHLL